uniref:Uncharacterized protein n=1 Tax=Glossina austeni TaxID=7395 RepID=A0A1A9UVN6_GLOAU
MLRMDISSNYLRGCFKRRHQHQQYCQELRRPMKNMRDNILKCGLSSGFLLWIVIVSLEGVEVFCENNAGYHLVEKKDALPVILGPVPVIKGLYFHFVFHKAICKARAANYLMLKCSLWKLFQVECLAQKLFCPTGFLFNTNPKTVQMHTNFNHIYCEVLPDVCMNPLEDHA